MSRVPSTTEATKNQTGRLGWDQSQTPSESKLHKYTFSVCLRLCVWQRNSRGDHLLRASGPVWVIGALLKDAEMVMVGAGD